VVQTMDVVLKVALTSQPVPLVEPVVDQGGFRPGNGNEPDVQQESVMH
jgi:hypothetical protein